MLKYVYIFIISLLTIHVFADNKQAIAFYKAGEPAIARQLLEKQLNGSPANKAEAFYYLGEIAYENNQAAEALSSYQKGWEASPAFALNKVGEGKVLLKTDKGAAGKAFDAAIKVNKKEAVVYVAIASAYQVNGMKEEAQTAIDNAKKYNSKEPAVYLYEGDQLLAANKPGDAAGSYEQAILFDPGCQEAYLKYAYVYQGVKPELSIEMLQKALASYPDYLPAYRNLGNVYSLQGAYAKAVTAYNNYFAGNLYSTDDLIHYASALFFNKQYTDAARYINEGLTREPDNFLLKRLSFYNDCETKAYGNGLEIARSFFQTSDGKFIWQDYLYYGRLLNENKEYDQAVAALNKALQDNNTHPEIYKDIADAYYNGGKDNEAIQAFTQYIATLGNAAETADYYQLGKYYYTSASKDSVAGKELLTKADSLFAIVQQRVPDSHLGSLWQARTNSLLDPETELGLAKPYYETCIPILESNKDKYRKELTECYRYLGYYFYLKQDMNNSKLYWNKVLEIDPANTMAQEALKNIK